MPAKELPTSEISKSGFAAYRNFGIFRFMLACLVMVHHIASGLAPDGLALLLRPYEIGSIAVMAFFVLSGFVIIEAADRVYLKRPNAFAINRALRITPHFLVAVVIAIFLNLVLRTAGIYHQPNNTGLIPSDAFSAENLIFNVISIIPLTDRFISYNFLEIAWAVRVEVAFYLVIFLALSAFNRISEFNSFLRRMTFEGYLSIFFLCSIPLFVMTLFGRGVMMFQYVPYFAFGVTLYYWVRGSSLSLFFCVVSLLMIIFHFYTLPPNQGTQGFERDAIGQFALLMILIATITLLAFLKSRRFEHADRSVGEITYPLYMSHSNVIIMMLSINSNNSYIWFFLTIFVCIVAARLHHEIIDPMVDQMRNRVRGVSL